MKDAEVIAVSFGAGVDDVCGFRTVVAADVEKVAYVVGLQDSKNFSAVVFSGFLADGTECRGGSGRDAFEVCGFFEREIDEVLVQDARDCRVDPSQGRV